VHTKKIVEVDGRPSRQTILQKSCLFELHQSTLTLCNMYDVLPAAMAVRPDFVNGGYDNGSYLWDRSFVVSDKKP
jgi:hypothetical protein